VLNEVAALAPNDTAKNAQVEAVQQLAPLMGLPSKIIKEALVITPASASTLEADLLARGNRSPLSPISLRAKQRVWVWARGQSAISRLCTHCRCGNPITWSHKQPGESVFSAFRSLNVLSDS
jgi:hypothetical protein